MHVGIIHMASATENSAIDPTLRAHLGEGITIPCSCTSTASTIDGGMLIFTLLLYCLREMYYLVTSNIDIVGEIILSLIQLKKNDTYFVL